MKIMNTDIPGENVEMTRNYYLLENDKSYQILVLYILRTLNNDIKQKIFDMLINEEITLELEEIARLANLYWLEYEQVFNCKNKKQKH